MVKTKISPRGLGAVRPATRGGLTSYTKQRTPSKQRRNEPRFHQNAPLIKANKLTEKIRQNQNLHLDDPGRLDCPLGG
jgi:hypothetical protein